MKKVDLKTSSRSLFFMMAMSAGLTLLPQELLAVENSIQAVQQSNEVEGVVKDASGEPIIGATVRVVGTKIATVTDLDGNFKIKAKSGQSLQFTYVGCKPKIVKVGRGSIAVTLEDDSQVLKDVQVVAYGVQKKVTVTGAISNINGSELTKVPTGSINNMLSGVVPGLSSVQYSGEPGADAATILVRGQATTNNSSPLIQVDGVERDFNDIDPSEIESITVLKDASATAVFGVRGANGVILVTTKRGKEGKAKISANTSMSVIVPTDPIKLANAYEYASYYNMQKLNDGAATAPFSDEILQKFKDHSDPLRFPDTDWIDYCFKDHAIQTQHNVNISGGTDRMRYFVSAGAFTQDGLFKQQSLPYDFNFKYQRFNYRANLDFDVTKTTTISVNLGEAVRKLN
jgi:TonB-linked SusC/RagA family outer membrane protein